MWQTTKLLVQNHGDEKSLYNFHSQHGIKWYLHSNSLRNKFPVNAQSKLECFFKSCNKAFADLIVSFRWFNCQLGLFFETAFSTGTVLKYVDRT